MQNNESNMSQAFFFSGWLMHKILCKSDHLIGQVRLLYDGKERGKLYAAYALSSIMTPTQPMTEVRAAGVIPALIFVLNNSRHLASKKGAMRAIGRLARVNETAAEIVEANGLPPIIALLDCEDLGIVKRRDFSRLTDVPAAVLVIWRQDPKIPYKAMYLFA